MDPIASQPQAAATSPMPAAPPLPLAELSLPASPGLWPLPIGWWCVLIGTLLAVVLGLILWHHRRGRHAAKREALALLQNPQLTLAEVAEILKRAALAYYPRHQVAGLTGGAWYQFLDQQTQPPIGFVSTAEQWQQGIYNATANAPAATQLREQALQWIKQALPCAKGSSDHQRHQQDSQPSGRSASNRPQSQEK